MFTRRSSGKKNQDDTSQVEGAGDQLVESVTDTASQTTAQAKESTKGFLGKAAGLISGSSDKSDAGGTAPGFSKPGLPEMPPLTPPGSVGSTQAEKMVSDTSAPVLGGVSSAAGTAGNVASKGVSTGQDPAGEVPRIPQRPSMPGVGAGSGAGPNVGGSSMPSNVPRQAAAPKDGAAPRPPAPPEPVRSAPEKTAAAPPRPVAVAPTAPGTSVPPSSSAAGAHSRSTSTTSDNSSSAARPAISNNKSSSATSDTSRRMPESKSMTDLPTASSTPSSSATSSPGFGVADHGQLIVGKDIELNGKVKNCEILIVEGTVEATLVNTKVLEVAEGGVFRGTAPVETAEISGLVEGDLIVDGHVLVRATGVVNGNIEFGELEIERGGRVHGSMLQFGEAARKKAAAAEARAAAKSGTSANKKKSSRVKKS